MGLFSELRSGSRQALAKAITLAESTLENDRNATVALINECLPYMNTALRVGVTGIPGVGKSTFLNEIGKLAADKGKKVAVLTVDPSSHYSKGSILGDKTRMDDLAGDDRIFVRPSPAADHLGGVSNRTREAAVLCEAAGYNLIFIETVGVGQSETAIADIVDFFLLLAMPGAGDELQGIKRGIMEHADAIFINKADGDLMSLANTAKATLIQSLKHFKQRNDGWEPKVVTGSSVNGSGIQVIWKVIEDFQNTAAITGVLDEKRAQQRKIWMHEALRENISRRLNTRYSRDIISQLEPRVMNKQKSPLDAAEEAFQQLFGK